jgi:hypothetical protein
MVSWTGYARRSRRVLTPWIALKLFMIRSIIPPGENGVTSVVLPCSNRNDRAIRGKHSVATTFYSTSSSNKQEETDQQLLLQADLFHLSRKIQKCGRDMAACMELLEKLPNVGLGYGSNNQDEEKEGRVLPTKGTTTRTPLQPIYLHALDVLNRSIRHHHSQAITAAAATTTMTAAPSSSSLSTNSTSLLLQQQQFRSMALQLYHDCPTESIRARTIAVCSSIDDVHHSTILTLLAGPPPPGIVTVNAALAALARDKDWSRARNVLFDHMSLVVSSSSTMSCNIVLLAMERAQQGTAALELLELMLVRDDDKEKKKTLFLPRPDRSSFHHVMRALIGSGGNNNHNSNNNINNNHCHVSAVDDAYKLMERMQNSYSIRPNNETLDLFASAYGRWGDWTMVGLVDRLRLFVDGIHVFPDPERYRVEAMTNRQQNSTMVWSSNARGLKQVGSGKEAYWEIANYESEANTTKTTTTTKLVVALQPHRNPSKNGIKILLLEDNDTGDAAATATRCSDDQRPRQKAGYLLMTNSRTDSTSTMIGVFIRPDLRRMGLSKTILSIWLDLCQRAGLVARTGVINKPLLALVLQHTFGFAPRPGGVVVEVAPGGSGSSSNNGRMVALYAPSLKSMVGAFSNSDLKRESIELLNQPPLTRGRLCHVKTAFVLSPNHDDAHRLSERVVKIKEGRLVYHSIDTSWRQVFIGTGESQH